MIHKYKMEQNAKHHIRYAKRGRNKHRVWRMWNTENANNTLKYYQAKNNFDNNLLIFVTSVERISYILIIY